MYARFKSSKGSLKLGLGTISNTRTNKVAVQNSKLIFEIKLKKQLNLQYLKARKRTENILM